jgi:hypothetical protein
MRSPISITTNANIPSMKPVTGNNATQGNNQTNSNTSTEEEKKETPTTDQEAEQTTVVDPEVERLKSAERIAKINADANVQSTKAMSGAQAMQAITGALGQGIPALASRGGGGGGSSGGGSSGSRSNFGSPETMEKSREKGNNFISSLDQGKIQNIQNNLNKLPPDLAQDVKSFLTNKDSSSYNQINHQLAQYKDEDGEKLSLENLATKSIEQVHETQEPEINEVNFDET